MLKKTEFAEVEKALQGHLAKRFKDVQVQIGEGIHYRGTNVVITTKAFAGLLPEQRFHHVVHAIPPAFYEKHLRSGVVWFELAPGEAAQAYMKLPRSEDVAKDEAAIRDLLAKKSFYPRLQHALGGKSKPSPLDFVVTRKVLAELGMSEKETERSLLHFIGRGAFSDADLAGALVSEADDDDDESDVQDEFS